MGRGWQSRRGGGRSSLPAMGGSPRSLSNIQAPSPVVGGGSGTSKHGRETSHQNSPPSGSHCNNKHNSNNNNNSPLPDAFGTPSSSSSSNSEMLLSHLSNKLTISETQTQTQTQSESETHPPLADPFDICPPKPTSTVVLKTPLFFKNRERRNQIRRNNDTQAHNGTILRPGMVHFKGYLSLTDQANIVKRCRELGLGCGGFYQPGYREGGKLHLKMMCLGKNWDPQTSQYEEHRSYDGAQPPDIPSEFHHLVQKAIQDSHALIQQQSKTNNPHNILPSMSSDICIVNFYSQNGRLGLHKDKDESPQSLHQGLPVVSFSIGDSADFLYGDEGDVDKAQKVVLESGDVLIFGGSSRNVFHGVDAIHQMSAPQLLLEQTNLRPGRLNLTFRQY